MGYPVRRILPLALLLALSLPGWAQDRGGSSGPGLVEPIEGSRIAWFATWEGARTEAQRTERPILLVSAAPHCHNISGLW